MDSTGFQRTVYHFCYSHEFVEMETAPKFFRDFLFLELVLTYSECHE